MKLKLKDNIKDQQNWPFEEIKQKTLQPDQQEKKKTLKIRNKRGDIKTDTTETQRIMREYYEELCSNKLENLKETGKFLNSSNPKFNSTETTQAQNEQGD